MTGRRRLRVPAARFGGCLIVLMLLLSGSPWLLRPAHASNTTCTLTGPTMTFGTINIFTTSATSGNATLNCTNHGAGVTVYACLSIGTGTGGTTPGNRTLKFGSNTIAIQITGGASWPPQIGDGTSYPMEGVVNFAIPQNGSASYTFPLVATIPAPSPSPSAGSYSSSFTGTDFQAYWDTNSQSSCTALVAAGTVASGTTTISATVVNQCNVTASNMNFGSASLLTSALSATAQIAVTCNAAIPLTIALDNGATGSGPTNRLMTSGTHTVTYGIYRDSGLGSPWGNTVGSNTASATGPSASLTAYGQVPAQPAPVPGSYADVVGVTVTY